MVDVMGYKKSRVGTELCFDLCNISAKYSKEPVGVAPDKTIIATIWIRSNNEAAIAFVNEKKYANDTESRDWEITTFNGYHASRKSINFTVSENKREEVFLRVAVGNVAIYTEFLQTVGKYDKMTPLEDGIEMVDEITAAVVNAIANS
jgi:hypothetical protein